MAVRNKDGLRAQIASLLADNTTGDIGAGDLMSVLTDMVDSLALQAVVQTDDMFFGTSADATPEASEATIMAPEGVGTVPAYAGSRHLLIFRLASEPDIASVLFSDDPSRTNQMGAFTKWSGGTLVPTGETAAFNVWVSNQALTQSATVTMTVS